MSDFTYHPVTGIAAFTNTLTLNKFEFERRDALENDVEIKIVACGICHSDLHQIEGSWEEIGIKGTYPMVCGHEFMGVVTKVGPKVTKFTIGDKAGIGCFINTCRTCDACVSTHNHHCPKGVFTYGGTDIDGRPTYGGYSQSITVNEDYVIKVGPNLDLVRGAPLLCAGITVWSPLRKFYNENQGKQTRCGVIGLGGLGHMAVKFAKSFGWHITVFSTSPAKKELALSLGADNFVAVTNAEELNSVANTINIMIDTVSGEHDLAPYCHAMAVYGDFVMVGLGDSAFKVPALPLVFKSIRFSGSLIGSINETQEMIDYCDAHNIHPETEIIPASYINKALQRLSKNDVKFRFSIDMSTLNAETVVESL